MHALPSNFRLNKRDALISICVWTLLALPYASHLYLYLTLQGFKTTWAFQFAEALGGTLTWAVLTPVMLSVAGKYPLLSQRSNKTLLIHIIAAALFSIVQVIFHTLVDGLLIHWNEPLQLWNRFTTILSRTYFFGLVIYSLVLALHTSFDFFKRKEVENAKARAEAAENELRFLKAQLQPHFLFNTLNTIVSLIYEDPQKAHEMISKLSQLLRMLLERDPDHTIALKQELELVKIYIEIQRVRFQDRLNVEYAIDEKVSELMIPCMLLQPLVENSIRHGIDHASGGTTHIKIAAMKSDSTLELSVRDNGITSDGSDAFGGSYGIGLSNLQRRLERLYGEKANLEIEHTGGFEVRISLPVSC